MEVDKIDAHGNMLDRMMSLTRDKEQTDAAVKVSQTQQQLNKSLMATVKDQNNSGSVDTYA